MALLWWGFGPRRSSPCLLLSPSPPCPSLPHPCHGAAYHLRHRLLSPFGFRSSGGGENVGRGIAALQHAEKKFEPSICIEVVGKTNGRVTEHTSLVGLALPREGVALMFLSVLLSVHAFTYRQVCASLCVSIYFSLSLSLYRYVYIYIYMCVCVCDVSAFVMHCCLLRFERCVITNSKFSSPFFPFRLTSPLSQRALLPTSRTVLPSGRQAFISSGRTSRGFTR